MALNCDPRLTDRFLPDTSDIELQQVARGELLLQDEEDPFADDEDPFDFL